MQIQKIFSIGLRALGAVVLTGNALQAKAAESFAGEVSYVACTDHRPSIDILDESLTVSVLTLNQTEAVKFVQSFDPAEQTREVGGRTYRRVQLPRRADGETLGWIDEESVVPAAACENQAVETETPGALDAEATPEPAALENDAPENISGYDVMAGFIFPTIKRPTASYKTGMRRFGAGRPGRKHAACDLYRVKNENVVSIAAGKVIRGRYLFYQGTYAIDIRHTGGKVVRYGEVTGKSPAKTGLGANIAAGQNVGYVAKVGSGCCEPMLHFELYAGTKTGKLSRHGGQYNRRADLIDPTSFLSTWERAKFGASY